MTDKEKIKAEIERYMKEYSTVQSSEGKYKTEAYKELLGFIEDMQEKPVSKGLEEAAFDYAEACKYDGGEKLLCVEHFKDGAQRQKERQMKDCTTGIWVYDSTAELCYVEITEDEGGKHYRLHSNGIETTYFADKVVYPLTLTTQRIAETVRYFYNRYFYANIMNADFRRELEDDFHELMHINLTSNDTEDKHHKIIERMEDHLQERLRHAKALHIRPRRK